MMNRKMTEKLNKKKNNAAMVLIQGNTATKEDENNKERIFMWKSISFSQIKGYPRLKFVTNRVIKSMPRIEIFGNSAIVPGNENAYSNLNLVLQKLTKILQDTQIFTITLAKDDTIFKLIREEKLIKIYNRMQIRDKHKPIEIILFK